MGKVLVIAEKPSVGQDIARVLKCKSKGDGYVYSDEHIVSWAIGHLVTLCEPEDYDEKYKKWRMETLPVIPELIKLKGIAKTKKQLVTLKKLMNSAEVDSLICATDSGREGELIFRYIYDITKCVKPFKRLWISSMTDKAINDGFAKLADGTKYDDLYASAKCRSEADWLVGMNATRAYTIKYNALLSVGRVQTPTLALMVERQKEIDAFEAKDFWEVMAFFGAYKGKWFDPAKDNETKLDTAEAADAIVLRAKGQPGVVISVENEEKQQPPPLLYDLTELQRDCNRKFGLSASKTLDIAQTLYEKRKMITYPRTDSRYVSDDMIGKLKTTMKKLAALEPYAAFAAPLAALEQLPISKRIVDNAKVTDHHAILPTDGRLNLESLTADERKVFDLVARRFVAVFLPYYIYNVTKVITLVGIDHFLSKGTVVKQLGWQALYKDDAAEDADAPKKKRGKAKTDEEDMTVLPPLAVNDEAVAEDVVAEKKATKPPKPYTEASLLSAMEHAGRLIEDEELREQMKDAGLGTPATRAAIIERLLQVQYIERKAKNLMPTEKGMKLIAVVPEELKSAVTTGKWEKGLGSIAKGTMNGARFMGSINRYVHYIIGSVKAADKSIAFPPDPKRGTGKPRGAESLGLCPVCGTGAMYENTKSFYCGRWREGCKFSIWKDAAARNGLTLTPDLVRQLLAAKVVKKIPVFMAQTGEKCVADLLLKPDTEARIEFVNMTRIAQEAETTTEGEIQNAD